MKKTETFMWIRITLSCCYYRSVCNHTSEIGINALQKLLLILLKAEKYDLYIYLKWNVKWETRNILQLAPLSQAAVLRAHRSRKPTPETHFKLPVYASNLQNNDSEVVPCRFGGPRHQQAADKTIRNLTRPCPMGFLINSTVSPGVWLCTPCP